jgi:hypothetical protein
VVQKRPAETDATEDRLEDVHGQKTIVWDDPTQY